MRSFTIDRGPFAWKKKREGEIEEGAVAKKIILSESSVVSFSRV